MKISISYKVGLLLGIPALGAILSILVFFSHMGHMDAQGFVIDVAGRQRMLSQTMLRYADMVVLLHQEEDRQPIPGFISEFDSALTLLDKGKESIGIRMSYAPADVAAEIAMVKQIWSQVKPALETIVEIPTGDPRVADAHLTVRELIPELVAESDKVVKAFYAVGSAARQRTEMIMWVVAGLNFFLLVAGYWFGRRYISRPVSLVERGIVRVSKGDYSYRVPVSGNDEIASLVSAFNEMSAKTKTALEEVAKLASAVQNMDDVLFITDNNGVFIYVNPAFERISGYSREEAIGKTPRLWQSGKTEPEKYRVLWETIQSGNSHKGMFINRKKSGDLFYYQQTISPLKDEAEHIINFISTGKDVTDLVKAENALRESERLNRDLVEQAPLGIAYLDASGVILYENPALLRMLGFAPGETSPMLGHNIRELASVISGVEAGAFDRAISPESFSISDVGYTSSKGVKVRMNVYLSPVFTEDLISGMVLQIVDITKTKEMETQLLHAQKMEIAGTLASGIAHDFNNILQGAIGNLDLLKMDLASPKEISNCLNYADAAIQAFERASQLTKRLLALGKIESAHMEAVNLKEIMENVVVISRGSIGRAVNVEVNFAGRNCIVNGDANQLGQVFLNLLINARDAISGKGNIRLECGEVELDETMTMRHPGCQPGRYSQISVIDDGSGIPAELMQRIFDPFFTTKEPGRGTGLGLAMVFNIVLMHHGFVEVQSEVGRGSTFHVFLPLMQ